MLFLLILVTAAAAAAAGAGAGVGTGTLGSVPVRFKGGGWTSGFDSGCFGSMTTVVCQKRW